MGQFPLGQFGIDPRFGFPVVPAGVLSDVFSPGAQQAANSGVNSLQQNANREARLGIADAENARAVEANQLARDRLVQNQSQFEASQALQERSLAQAAEQSALQREFSREEAEKGREFEKTLRKSDLLLEQTKARLEGAREDELIEILRAEQESSAIGAALEAKVQISRLAGERTRRELDTGLEDLSVQLEDHSEMLINVAEKVGLTTSETVEEVSTDFLESLADENLGGTLIRTMDGLADGIMDLFGQRTGTELFFDLHDQRFESTNVIWGEDGVVTRYHDNLQRDGVFEGMNDAAKDAAKSILNATAMLGYMETIESLGGEGSGRDEQIAATRASLEEMFTEYRDAGGDPGVLAEVVNGLRDVGLAMSGGTGDPSGGRAQEASQNSLFGRVGQFLSRGHKELKLVGREAGFDVTENSDLIAVQAALLELKDLGVSAGRTSFESRVDDLLDRRGLSTETRERLEALRKINRQAVEQGTSLEALLEERLAGEAGRVSDLGERRVRAAESGRASRREVLDQGVDEALSVLGG